MNKSKALVMNTLILSIGQLIPKIISLITLPLLTAYFTTSQYGIYDLLLSLSSLSIPILTLLTQQAAFRYIIDSNNDNDRSKYICNSIIIFLAISFLNILILIIYCKSAKTNILFFLIIFLLYFSESLYDLIGQYSRGLGDNKSYSIASIIYSTINFILIIALYITGYLTIFYALTIMALSYLLSSIYLFYKIKAFKYVDFKYIDFNIIKQMIKYSLPIIPNSIALWVVSLSDRFIITNVLGTSYNGIYAAANKIPNLLFTAYSIFNLAWTELAARTIKEEDIEKYYSLLFKKIFNFLTGVVIILIFCSPILFKVLINNKFMDGYTQMPILFVGIMMSCLSSFYGGIYIALKKTKTVGVSSLVGASINILINLLLINRYGLYAASISTLISFFMICLYRKYDLKKSINIEYDYKNIIINVVNIVLLAVLYYIGNLVSMILALILAFIYNYVYNKDFIFEIIQIIKIKFNKR